MMGKQDDQREWFSYKVNLDQRVRKDHPLRRVLETVDFSFVRGEVSQFYGVNGNESVDPEVIMKMMFLLFFDNVPSERKLMATIPERLDYMWFLGYGLDDEIPNHSVLSKARKRWGPEVFESLFVRTVLQCVEAGLVDGGKLHFDGSLVDANASNDSVITGPPELISQLKAAFRRESHKLDEAEADVSDRKSSYQKKNDGLVSTTDPDTDVTSKRGVCPRLRYKNHRAVDDLNGVITGVRTTSGVVEENSELFNLIDQSEHNTGFSVHTAVADSQYGTVDNFRECGKRGIKSHMTDLAAQRKKNGQKKRIFQESDFVYDEERDVYVCPAGNILKRRRHKKRRKAYEYAIGAKTCNPCELRPQCTNNKLGRSVKRHEDHELIEAERARSKSREALSDRARRKHIAEGSFADAKNNHGFKRARWRRLWRQSIQDLLIAAIQNIRIFIARGGFKPTAGEQKLINRTNISPVSDFSTRLFAVTALTPRCRSIRLIFCSEGCYYFV